MPGQQAAKPNNGVRPAPEYVDFSDRRVLVVGIFLLVLTTLLMVIFVQVFAVNMPTSSNATADVPVLFFTFANTSAEVRLLLLVFISGALGSLLRAIGSFARYVGSRSFISSWIPFYYFQPFVGGLLGTIFYLVVRGVFFAPGTSAGDVSLVGAVALAALMGLFNGQAMKKLEDIATTLFASSETTDSLPESAEPGAEAPDGTATKPAPGVPPRRVPPGA